jgi:ubiquinone biosynthesis protein COQ4
MSEQTVAQPDAPYSNRIRPLVAWRAWKALLADKEDTGQVFKMIEALKGKSMENTLATVRASEVGKRLLAEKPAIRSLLNDREALRAMPEGSLGRAYLEFMESEDLTADGLMEASFEAPRAPARDEDMAWLGEHLRDLHDLYHVSTGYGRDGFGEIGVLTFGNVQTKNRGISFLVFMAERQNKKEFPDLPIAECLKEARDHGRAASYLASVDWEAMLPKSLEQVREELGIAEPRRYRETLPKMAKIIEERSMNEPVAL